MALNPDGSNKKIRFLAVLNAVCFLMHFVPSQLSQFKILGPLTMGEVSNKYDSYFTPAGFTFAIWGVIYVGLIGFCGYHLVKALRADVNQEANLGLLKINYLFAINNIATGLWVFVFLQERLLLSVGLMLIQLVTLLLINIRLQIYTPGKSAANRWFTQIPLSIYFAWICIATIANTCAWLVSEQWPGFGITEQNWAIILISIATALAVFVILNRRNSYFGLVVIWALYGIIQKQNQLPATGYITTAAWLGFSLVAVMVIFQFYRNQLAAKKSNHSPSN